MAAPTKFQPPHSQQSTKQLAKNQRQNLAIETCRRADKNTKKAGKYIRGANFKHDYPLLFNTTTNHGPTNPTENRQSANGRGD